MNDFQKNRYVVIKNAISKELAEFCCDYFSLKRDVHLTMLENRYISPYVEYFGKYDDPQVPGTYSHYSDIVMETLLSKLLPVMEKNTGLKLYPNYSYARIYKKGDVLKRHKDRISCEISTTLSLGGDAWPIYLEPNKNIGNPKEGKPGITWASNNKGKKVNLKPGDMLIYRGCDLEHWREALKGNSCTQVFLHYSDQKQKGAKENIFDGRPHLGLCNYFNAKKIK